MMENQQQYHIGIDPGKTGAACLICSPDIEIFDWAGIQRTSAKIREWQESKIIVGAFIEDVHSIPSDGHLGAFRFGKNFGAWLAILATLGIDTKTISPKQWRKGLYAPGDRRPIKARSIDSAVRLFPSYEGYFKRSGDHNRAESALIAYQAERWF